MSANRLSQLFGIGRGASAALITGILVTAVALGGGSARAQGGACSVDNFLSAPSLGAFIGSLQAAGANVAACADFLELVFIDNVFILTPEAFAQMIAAAGSPGGGNGGNNGNGGKRR